MKNLQKTYKNLSSQHFLRVVSRPRSSAEARGLAEKEKILAEKAAAKAAKEAATAAKAAEGEKARAALGARAGPY